MKFIQTVRILSHNIASHLLGTKGPTKYVTITVESWKMNERDAHKTYHLEIHALLVLLYMCGLRKSFRLNATFNRICHIQSERFV